jgi:hypothetical protein
VGGADSSLTATSPSDPTATPGSATAQPLAAIGVSAQALL